MSHFTVLVVGENVEEQLAPYQENNMGDCPKEYLEFNDVEDEYRDEYENETHECVRMLNGEIVSRYDKQFRKYITARKENGNYIPGSIEYVIPPCLKIEDIKFNERFFTFDEYMKEYVGYEKDPEIGKYGFWENPNAKWDWYTIGGRWDGFFYHKNGTKVNQIYKKDIDFETPKLKGGESAKKDFKIWMDLVNKYGKPESWEDVKNRLSDIAEARNFYNNQETLVKAIKSFGYSFIPFEQYFGYNEEEYILQKCIDKTYAVYSILKDGKWYSNGEMGWWGISHGEDMMENEWRKQTKLMIENLSDDTFLTIVDCHI